MDLKLNGQSNGPEGHVHAHDHAGYPGAQPGSIPPPPPAPESEQGGESSKKKGKLGGVRFFQRKKNKQGKTSFHDLDTDGLQLEFEGDEGDGHRQTSQNVLQVLAEGEIPGSRGGSLNREQDGDGGNSGGGVGGAGAGAGAGAGGGFDNWHYNRSGDDNDKGMAGKVAGGASRDREGLNSVGSMLEGGDVGDDGYTKMERQQMVNLSNLNARLDRCAPHSSPPPLH